MFFKFSAAGIVGIQSVAAGTDPQHTRFIAVQTTNVIVAQYRFGFVGIHHFIKKAFKGFAFGVEEMQTIIGPYPKTVFIINSNCSNVIAVECLFIAGISTKCFEAIEIFIIAVQSPFERTDPELSACIGKQNIDPVIANRTVVTRIVFENSDLSSVVAVQSIISTHPQKSILILCDGIHPALRQTLFLADVFEFKFLCVSEKRKQHEYSQERAQTHALRKD